MVDPYGSLMSTNVTAPTQRTEWGPRREPRGRGSWRYQLAWHYQAVVVSLHDVSNPSDRSLMTNTGGSEVRYHGGTRYPGRAT